MVVHKKKKFAKRVKMLKFSALADRKQLAAKKEIERTRKR